MNFRIIFLIAVGMLCGYGHVCNAFGLQYPHDSSLSYPDKQISRIAGPSADIEKIRALPDDRWQPLGLNQDNLGFCDDEVWVRMQFNNPDSTHAIRQVLEVPFARMDYVDWYVFEDDELIKTAHSGSMLSCSDGAPNTRYPALAFIIGPSETVQIYVRIQSETVIHVHFMKWNADEYMAEAQRRETYAAMKMGILIALLALAYLFVWGFREAGSVWFPLAFTFFSMGVSNLAGYWPDLPGLSCYFRVKTLFLICGYWSIAFLLLHIRHFYDMKTVRPRLARWILWMGGLYFVLGLASFGMPFRQGLGLTHLMVLVSFAAIIVVAGAMHTGRVSSWLNLTAFLIFFGYLFAQFAFAVGLIPFEVQADHAGFLAASITMLLFILAQAWRVRELHAGYVAAVQLSQAERERRLADQHAMLRDLHDGLGGITAAVSLMAAYGKRNPDIVVKNERFGAIERMMSYAAAEIRSLMNALEQPAPYWADWLYDLREYAAGILEASRIEFQWETVGNHPEKWTGFAPALSLMRVIKEALNNAVKHACADRISIRLHFIGGRLEIRVLDNGKGIDRTPSARGRGLSNMEKRLKELGGEFHVYSSVGGTEVLIEVTVSENDSRVRMACSEKI